MAGQAAVIFFFVLSGFVLALPFLKQNTVLPYRPFIIKRVCRIYPTYLVALAFAISMNALCYRGPVPGLSNWFATFWEPHIDWHAALQHVFLVNSFNFNKFNIVIWTLTMEMRLSLLFPLIMYCILKFGWKTNLLGGVLLCLIGWICHFLRHQGFLHHDHDYFNTLFFVPMFIVGALLAQHRSWLTQKFMTLSRTMKYAAFSLALFAYTNANWLPQLFPSASLNKLFSQGIAQDFIVITAVAAFIIMAISSGKISRFLLLRPLHYLGKISYSFYLFHMICLLALVHLFYGVLPFSLIVVFVIVTSITIAAISYHWIELPFIRLGKYLQWNAPKP